MGSWERSRFKQYLKYSISLKTKQFFHFKHFSINHRIHTLVLNSTFLEYKTFISKSPKTTNKFSILFKIKFFQPFSHSLNYFHSLCVHNEIEYFIHCEKLKRIFHFHFFSPSSSCSVCDFVND